MCVQVCRTKKLNYDLNQSQVIAAETLSFERKGKHIGGTQAKL